MTTAEADKAASSGSRTVRREEASRVVDALARYIATLSPGDRIPTHSELMGKLGASERVTLNALNEMQRRGRIIRRVGLGTFVQKVEETGSAGIADSRTIVAIMQPDHSYFDRCVEVLYEHAAEQDLSLVCRVVSPSNSEALTPENLGNPFGFIVFRYAHEPLARQLMESGQRVVIVGGIDFGKPVVPVIYGDQDEGGYLLVRHLIQLGHRRIASVHDGSGKILAVRSRGHDRAVSEACKAGIFVTKSILDVGELERWRRDPMLVKSYFAAPDAPTALAAWNDGLAIYMLSLLNRAKIDVPGQVSVVGYDALPQGKDTHPSLTTVDGGISQQIRTAVRLLTQDDAPMPGSERVTMPSLIVRESTGPPPS